MAIPGKATRADDPALSTTDLVVRARSGDDAALEQLIRNYQRAVTAMVLSMIGDDGDWPDLCQQIFVKMVHGLPRLKATELFEPWLFRIARNACFDHLRRRRRRGLLVRWEPWHAAIAVQPEDAGRLESTSVALEDAIRQLPADQRQLMILLRDRAWSYQALARLTGASLGAIKSRIFRARRRLRYLMTTAELDHEK